MIFGSLVCRFRGHLRGKLVKRVSIDKTAGGQANYVATYCCGRCGVQWTRKVKRIEAVA